MIRNDKFRRKKKSPVSEVSLVGGKCPFPKNEVVPGWSTLVTRSSFVFFPLQSMHFISQSHGQHVSRLGWLNVWAVKRRHDVPGTFGVCEPSGTSQAFSDICWESEYCTMIILMRREEDSARENKENTWISHHWKSIIFLLKQSLNR